ncbi:DNA-binding transcriptional regulator, CsgD family [Azospirillum oryzae]|uniref:DNA-binding transcriptional regulator, CsgD family n=1 Tax=Azospirillum oryzae TaxID=286727 RepID=A0A1X7HCF1_9PROT|nr:helix-turn-helix transcriptional regulator [Azospirillum oryzae]SMF83921.1 DNA-binding transcriptional regulator, CsgD family [Azospirillum oryzae]
MIGLAAHSTAGLSAFFSPGLPPSAEASDHQGPAAPLGVRSTGTVADVDAFTLVWLLDRLDQIVLLVDAGAHLLFANRAAEEMLREGRSIRLHNGTVETSCRSETRALQDAVTACLQLEETGGKHALPIVCGRGATPLAGCVAALPAELRGTKQGFPVAALFLADPRCRRGPSAAQLQSCFGLTAAEASLAREILAGDGLQACAGRLGISQTTARTHLGHVFEKTGTRRQAELVRLLSGLRPQVRFTLQR